MKISGRTLWTDAGMVIGFFTVIAGIAAASEGHPAYGVAVIAGTICVMGSATVAALNRIAKILSRTEVIGH